MPTAECICATRLSCAALHQVETSSFDQRRRDADRLMWTSAMSQLTQSSRFSTTPPNSAHAITWPHVSRVFHAGERSGRAHYHYDISKQKLVCISLHRPQPSWTATQWQAHTQRLLPVSRTTFYQRRMEPGVDNVSIVISSNTAPPFQTLVIISRKSHDSLDKSCWVMQSDPSNCLPDTPRSSSRAEHCLRCINITTVSLREVTQWSTGCRLCSSLLMSSITRPVYVYISASMWRSNTCVLSHLDTAVAM